MQKTVLGRDPSPFALNSGIENLQFLTKYFSEIWVNDEIVFSVRISAERRKEHWRLFIDCQLSSSGLSEPEIDRSHERKIHLRSKKDTENYLSNFSGIVPSIFKTVVVKKYWSTLFSRWYDTILACLDIPHKVVFVGDWRSSLLRTHRPALAVEQIKQIINALIRNKLLTEINLPHKNISVAKISLGADPEFEAIDENGDIVSAKTLFEEEDFDVLENEIGTDWADAELEIRPEPSTSPTVLVRNIRRLLRLSREYTKQVSVKGEQYPLGGHIHLGISPNRRLITVLDDFFGRKLLSLSGKGRKGSGYNRISQWRRQPHGFEYRTPPSIWCENPRIAKIVLKIAQNVAQSWVKLGVLSYDQKPTDADYMKIAKLTPKETAYFREFCERKNHRSRSILAAWGVRKCKKR
jgi:hypothetical protein